MPSQRRVVLVDGCRIPFQRSGTGYRDQTSYDLGRMALTALLERNRLEPSAIGTVVMGTVVSSLGTSNVARESALGAGIPRSVPAHTVSQACISANQAIAGVTDSIRAGRIEVGIAGGTESLTDIPIRLRRRLRDKLVASQKYRGPRDYLRFLKGLRLSDLLPEIPAIAEFSTGRTMGQDCDRLAARFGVTRNEQDQYALRSHQLAHKAFEAGRFNDEVEVVRLPPGFKPVGRDNGVRADSTIEKLASLKPAFVKPHGTVTAGNSSFLSDGAAAVLLMSEEFAEKSGIDAKAVVRNDCFTAQDPREELLLGPAFAVPRVFEQAGVGLSDIDVFEFHEAFAGQVLANLRCLESETFARDVLGRDQAVGEIPLDKLNAWGGSLSIGHPFGATGARLVTTAANRLQAEDGQLALVASCAAGALGSAIILERAG